MDYQDLIASKRASSPPEKTCKACGRKFLPVDLHGHVSSKQHCSDPACERRREVQRKKRGRKRRDCDAFAVVENRRTFERDMWRLLRPLYIEEPTKAVVTGKAGGLTRITPKQKRSGVKYVKGQRKHALRRLFGSARIPATWRMPLLEYICRRSAPPRARFWVAMRLGVLPDEVLRPFVLDMIDHRFPDQQTVILLRGLDPGVWIPPEKCDPATNERLVSFRPVFREARAAASDVMPTELFMEDALESARCVSSHMFNLGGNEEEEFKRQIESLSVRTSKYRQQFY